MPSGMLCRVTAKTRSVVRFRSVLAPSGSLAPGCRWGSSPSSSMRNATPNTKPPAAGIHPGQPAASASSIAGMSRDQTEAAVIIPAAKPRKIRCIPAVVPFLKNKTTEAPKVVIRKVNPVPPAAQ